MLFCLDCAAKYCYGNQLSSLIHNINIFDFFLGISVSGECVPGPSTESHVPTGKAPKPFLSFRKSKRKEWKSLV